MNNNLQGVFIRYSNNYSIHDLSYSTLAMSHSDLRVLIEGVFRRRTPCQQFLNTCASNGHVSLVHLASVIVRMHRSFSYRSGWILREIGPSILFNSSQIVH